MATRPFEQVVTDHGPTVLRVCRALAPAQSADDAWSETFLSAMRAYPDLDDSANVEAWLVTIARRKCIDLHRAGGRRAVPVAAPEDAPRRRGAAASRTDLPGEGSDEELWSALRSLPPRQREAVVYHHLAGLPYAQVGELVGSSDAAARRAAADGMRRLRTIYGEVAP